MQRRKPLANRQVIDLFDRGCRSFLTGFGSDEVCEKLLEIDAVVAKGVRAYVALITQVFEELLDELLHKGLPIAEELSAKSEAQLHFAPGP